jgi:outer membrane protein OmpA-like peptidoglycan-associated protein
MIKLIGLSLVSSIVLMSCGELNTRKDSVEVRGFVMDDEATKALGGVGNYVDRGSRKVVAAPVKEEPKVEAPKPAPVADSAKKVEARKVLKQAQNSVYFGVGSSKVAGKDLQRMTKLAALMKQDSSIHIQLTGHADATGDAAKNQVLSEKRVAAVAAMFHKAGVPDAQVHTSAHGAGEAAADNKSTSGRAMNRRVEVTLVDM